MKSGIMLKTERLILHHWEDSDAESLYGKAMIRFVAEHYKGQYQTLQVGTGDSPITVPFYESCGFVRHHVDKNFILDNYDHPIFEGGKQLKDMVYLRMQLEETPE